MYQSASDSGVMCISILKNVQCFTRHSREMAILRSLVDQSTYREILAGGWGGQLSRDSSRRRVHCATFDICSQSGKLLNMSEKELGKKWDRCLADGAVKIGK